MQAPSFIASGGVGASLRPFLFRGSVSQRLGAPPRRTLAFPRRPVVRNCVTLSTNAAPPRSAACTRLARLRAEMARRGADAVVVPSGDPHNSEYAAGMYSRREWLSGFTGSAGVAVVTADAALLWTDGRYFLQAATQLGQEWTLMRGGEKGTPSVREWLTEQMRSGSKVAIDPFVHTAGATEKLRVALEEKDVALLLLDPPNVVDVAWGEERPAPPKGRVRLHPLEMAGVGAAEKIAKVREAMREKGATRCLFSMLDEVCWLYNIRGEDVPHCPVVISYALVSENDAILYIDSDKLDHVVTAALVDAGVTVAPYERVVPDIAEAATADGACIWMDGASTSVALHNAAGDAALLEETPVCLLKAVKNEAELKAMRAAHLRDAAALVQFLHWLEVHVSDGSTISEVDAAAKLRTFRAMQEGFIDTSFTTIAGAGSNGAIIHYSPQPDECAQVSRDEVFLLDSGGQYVDGTTDVTRTMHLGGTPTAHERACFTRVLQGHIALDSAVFPEDTTGLALDTLARAPLWGMGLDFRHGVGHGVGACLNVHEGPHSISSRPSSAKAALRAGMIVSNEPGYYEDGRFGIRIENLIYVVEKETPFEFGGKKYLGFERLTHVPIDKSMIDVELLSKKEIEWIDRYHEDVWDRVSPLIEDENEMALRWLMEKTEPIKAPVTAS